MTNIKASGLYCAYLRKSRKDLELEAMGQQETLSRHEQALGELASRLGICISRTYREIVSGDTIAERPEIRKLLEDVNAGHWDGVLVMDVDRLGRGDSIDQGVIMQSFLYSSTLIITPDKIYDPAEDSDNEFFEIKLFFARREYSMIKKRMQRGRLASAMDGCYMGARPVYGYERYKLPGRKGWSLKVVPEKAEIVRAVYEWYAHGMDGREVGAAIIANRLNDMGLRTDLGKAFEPSYVRLMLSNPIYIGKVRWNHRQTVYRIEDGKRVKSRPLSDNEVLVDGHHEAIVDRALWDEVQDMFKGHAKPPRNVNATTTNPLSGLVICGCCGKHMQRKPSPNRQGDFVFCTTSRCPTASAYISAVEDAMMDTLRDWAVAFEGLIPATPADDTAAFEASRQQLTEQRDSLTAQLDRQYDLLEQGVYTTQEFRRRREDINAQIERIDSAIASLAKPPKPDPRIALLPQIKNVLEAYGTAPDAAEKNRLLKSVFDHAVYHKTQRGQRNNAPGDFLRLELFPRIPKTDN